MMTTPGQDFEIVAGESRTLSCTVTSATGAAVDLTGLSGSNITWVLKSSRTASATLSKTIGSGVTLDSDPTTGIFTVALTSANTTSLNTSSVPITYIHEARVTIGSQVDTIFYGNVTVLASAV